MNKLYKLLICFLPLLLWSTEVKQDKEQILRLNLLSGAPKSLHPHLTVDSGGAILCKALFEGLTRFDLKGNVECALASRIKISKCKTKYTICLRPSTWSNGRKLTAYHFVNAWKAGIAPGTKCTRASRFFVIKNAEKVFRRELPMKKVGIYALSEQILVIKLEHPVPYFTQLLADPVFSPLFDTSDMEINVLNGPFIVGNFQPEKAIQLKRNSLYWGAKTVNLSGVEISFVQNAMTAYKLFKRGELDFIGSPFSAIPEEVVQKGKLIKKAEEYSPYWIHFNLKKSKFQSKKIRKALSLAVNREDIANYILPNANPNYNILPKGLSSLKLDSNQKSAEDIQKLFKEGLEEIKCKNKDYIIELSSACEPRHTKIANYLKHCWEKMFNIQVTLKQSDWNTFQSNLISRNYTMGGLARCSTYEDPSYFLEYFLSADRNYSNWENPEFNKWMDLADNCISDEKRKEYLNKAEELLTEEVPVICLYTNKHLYLCNPALENFIPSKLVYCDFRWAYFKKRLANE